MNQEKILIFGDSYSTYEGYIPEGYATYYPKTNELNVCDVTHTWWKMLAEETDSDIIMNNSWSGSTICNTGYSGDCSATSSFIHRLDVLIETGFFVKNKIDRIFVFGGTNDSWSGNLCGELKFSDWTVSDLKLILPGICFFIDKLQSVVSKEKIHIIINTELRDDICNGILDICKHYDINYTMLNHIEKIEGHPTYKGMIQIKNQILNNIN